MARKNLSFLYIKTINAVELERNVGLKLQGQEAFYVVSKKDMAAYVIPNFELIGLDVDLNSTYIAGFLFLVLNHFFFLGKIFHGK